MAAVTCTPTAIMRCDARASSSRSHTPYSKAALSARTFVAPRVNLSTRRTTGVARQSKLVVKATTMAAATPETYTLPCWNDFEMGMTPVLWEPEFPKAGDIMTMWYNPEYTALRDGYYTAFNGGFNGPFMCADEPRGMANKTRGKEAIPLYSIRIQIPRHAVNMEFGFTDGKNWDEGYKISFKSPKDLAGNDFNTLQQGLEKEMATVGACEEAIFPDDVPDAVYCKMPGGGGGLVGQSCNLDIIVGCTNPEASNYDPMATVDGNSCEL